MVLEVDSLQTAWCEGCNRWSVACRNNWRWRRGAALTCVGWVGDGREGAFCQAMTWKWSTKYGQRASGSDNVRGWSARRSWSSGRGMGNGKQLVKHEGLGLLFACWGCLALVHWRGADELRASPKQGWWKRARRISLSWGKQSCRGVGQAGAARRKGIWASRKGDGRPLCLGHAWPVQWTALSLTKRA